ncbi:MAG: prefoldin subunit beta [Candidatus Micrarchaeota archaeon]
MDQMNPEFEKNVAEYQTVERQLQSVLLQKHQIQIQLNEIAIASEEIVKAKDDIYKATGSILMKTTKEEGEKDLKNKKDLLEIRLKALIQQEEKLKPMLLNLQKKIEANSKNYDVSS